jgi:hypothetical protein
MAVPGKEIIMKRFFGLILLGFGVLQTVAMGAPADGSTNSLYTIDQLTNLIQARIDTNLFAAQMSKWGIKLDVATVLYLQTNGVSEADLRYMGQCTNSQISSANSRPYQAFITSGAEFMNPYAISVTGGKGVLTNAGNSTVGFVEFDYINRHVLRVESRDNGASTNWGKFGGNWICPFKEAPDVQFTMGFFFDNGSGITNQSYTAQTLAGADFYSQLSLGFPLWRLDIPNQQSHQVSLECSGGVVTEKSFEELHPNAFVGLGYETSFSPFLQSTTTNACGFFEAKAGVGWVDLPSLVGTNNLVNLDGNEIPIFNLKAACEIEAYLAYPLTSKIYLTVDATDYLGNKPPQSWNIKVGASIPLDGIAKSFSSLLGGSQ